MAHQIVGPYFTQPQHALIGLFKVMKQMADADYSKPNMFSVTVLTC